MNRPTTILALAAAALFWGGVLLGHANGFRINHTRSLPVGLWRIAPPGGPIEPDKSSAFVRPPPQSFGRPWRKDGSVMADAVADRSP